jgi:hypothetical protein
MSFQETITVKKSETEKNIYTVKYSNFTGSATILTDNKGSISEVKFKTQVNKSMSAYDLREFPLGAVETIIKNRSSAQPAKTRPSLDRPNSLNDVFLKNLSHFYIDALTRNERPLVAISKATGAPHSTSARWVAKARKEGFLR